MSDEVNILDLLTRLYSDTAKGFEREKELVDQIRNFYETDLMEFVKNEAPDNAGRIFADFEDEIERFSEFMMFPEAASRNVVAIGGAFSSGKTSLLNAILGEENYLPTNIAKTTSIPTYILNENTDSIGGINLFNTVLSLKQEELTIGTHLFKDKYNISLARVLKTLFIETQRLKFDNLVLLDTPGYSAADDRADNSSDRQIALNQLNNAHFIVWVADVTSEAGMSSNDLKFLAEVDKDIPLIILMNKAFMRRNEISSLQKHIERSLKRKGIKYDGIFPIDTRQQDLFPLTPLNNYLEQWNTIERVPLFAKTFKKLFILFRTHYDQRITEERRDLSALNKAITLVENSDVATLLNSLQLKTKVELDELTKLIKNLDEQKDKFFSLLGEAGNAVGISLPEASTISLIEKKNDFSSILQAYGKKVGQTEFNMAILTTLKESLPKIKPTTMSPVLGNAEELREQNMEILKKALTQDCNFASLIGKDQKWIDEMHLLIQNVASGVKEHV